ncbi:MAG: UDP-N-acetylmuramoyl-L-alanine--D-glutamate ligase, partial [Bacteroidales bacterium]
EILKKCDVPFITGENYLKELVQKIDTFDLILKTPGISLKDYPLLLHSPKLSSQADLFLKLFAKQVIGVSGTKGKSTTTHLIYHFLKEDRPCLLAGNMGIPFFDILSQIEPNTTVVCEFSSHQLEQVHTPAHISVLLNLFEEHLDHYQSFEDYQRAKMHICAIDKQSSSSLLEDSSSVFIYHIDDSLLKIRSTEVCLPKNIETFSLLHPVERGLYKQGHYIVSTQEGRILDLNRPHPLIGDHNILNWMAAMLSARMAGLSFATMVSRIDSFKPLPHRLEYIGCVGEVHYFNDSISTIPQAAVEAIKSVGKLDFVKEVGCLILGGFDRGIDYRFLVDYLKENPIKNIIFVGESGQRIFRLLEVEKALPIHYLKTDDYTQVVRWAKEKTLAGEACLLSPAAASYDHFKNFEERGKVFTNLVLQGEASL